MDKQILLIEDEPYTVKAFIEQLEEDGDYAVDVARDVPQGVKLLSEKSYDLLILDIMLPHGDEIDQTVSPKRSGIVLIPMVRTGKVGEKDVSNNRNVPLIVITAISDYASLREIKALKPYKILRKPVPYKDFLDAVKGALGESVLEEADEDKVR